MIASARLKSSHITTREANGITLLIKNTPLREDIEQALLLEGCVVRVLWRPEGYRENTRTLNVTQKGLSGVLYLTMTATELTPISWLCESVSDGFPGHLVQDHRSSQATGQT